TGQVEIAEVFVRELVKPLLYLAEVFIKGSGLGIVKSHTLSLGCVDGAHYLGGRVLAKGPLHWLGGLNHLGYKIRGLGSYGSDGLGCFPGLLNGWLDVLGNELIYAWVKSCVEFYRGILRLG